MKILHGGRATFKRRGQLRIDFPKPVDSDYVVMVTSSGALGGGLASNLEVFSVTSRDERGFTITSGNNNSVAEVSFLAVEL